MRLIKNFVRKILYKIPLFLPSLLAEDISTLEKRGRIEEACQLRLNWLRKLSLKYAGPLWCSEGEYLLKTQKKYHEALNAFENAMESKFTPSLNPLRIYCGASVAAVMCSDLKKAEDYFSEAVVWYNKFKEGNRLDTYLSKFDETFAWLSEQIYPEKSIS